ncbi:GTP diphosphokinase chloroplastic isoform X1 isoform A [Chlorella sorokiniana]|uniref:Putative GTP diphosphokinase RSH1, chloroplastic n=1 Tax=Chlorella sorokiniana TaxID=3076 RepID=A0A2P6TCK1_CHLSO|nr:GTP diphosphokinase chloroplastic isoform X1 isoform A [Chlorella sorokiniana]|eukprot:PRW20358.1 GTP diphosphokinase chloroplastic isoform X1 isoform A [Chlorella sorokiniana]
MNSGLLKGQWAPALLHLGAAGQLASSPWQGPGEAAWLTMASLFTLAASFSGAVYYMARTTWDSIEPYVFQQQYRAAQPPVLVHGVDVAGSRFFSRPIVRQAADFAAAAHSGQIRKTRQPYVTHCIETALVVEGLLSPTEEDARAEAAVVAALLHDTLDDTDVEFGELEQQFGAEVASMVSKVSQLSTTNQIVRRRLRVESLQQSVEEEEALRKMILTMVGEPLVIAIKLADRLHNMRTVYALSPEKQAAVASETRRVWCSLAERLGMFALKSELEDLCFAVLQPGEYRKLRRELDELWGVPTIPQQAALSSIECCLDEECECVLDEQGALHRVAYPGSQPSSSASSSSASSNSEPAAAAALRERQQSHAAASTSSSSSSSSTSSGTTAAGAAGSAVVAAAAAAGGGGGNGFFASDLSWLTPEQQEMKQLIDTVLPFDATTFNIAKLRSGAAGRRGLEVLQACAQLLMREIGTESLASGLEVTVQGRLKSLYSTFKKMARKQVPLKEVYDARALRVIVDDEGGSRQAEAIAACYQLLPAVHRLFRRVAGEEDDYIAQPKPSGYQSLHTAVIGPGGVPMEVQMRTSSMHADAEYGKAAHWAYKERPAGAPPPPPVPAGDLAAASTSSSDEGEELEHLGVEAGHPLLHIKGGRLRDAVVLHSEMGGRHLLCAVSQAARATPGARPAAADEYRHLAEYCEQRGFFGPSQGDLAVRLDTYSLCNDGKYYRVDRFGHKLAENVVPLSLADEAQQRGAEGQPAPEHQAGPGAGAGEMDFMMNRIRLLRIMLEWGQEVGSSIAAEHSGAGELPSSDAAAIAAWRDQQLALPDTGAQSSDVLVVVWPGGRILRLPRGATAGSVIRDHGLIEIQPDTLAPSGDGLPTAAAAADAPSPAGGDGSLASSLLVNVNNRLVPEETPLSDGDYVVLSRDRERLLSHSQASCRSTAPTWLHGHRHASARTQAPSAWREAPAAGLRQAAAPARAARRRRPAGCPTLARALQAADYSFYQRLREGELTESYLWETRLLPLLGYLSADETTAVREALSLAYDAHAGQKRKSGEPFITHPVEVTRILAELRMDYESLVAGLLHDTVEDCGDVVGLDEINFHFGSAVRRIVEGETKFSKLPTHHPEDRNSSTVFSAQGGRPGGVATSEAASLVEAANGAAGSADPKAQDLQFLFLAMTEEVRIIVVKLADRLHNMRTMAAMPPAKQRRIAQETLQVFAPLARLLGLYAIKEELEELSFKYAHPREYDAMKREVARLWQAQAPVVEAAQRELQEKLESDPYLRSRVGAIRVEASRKALYSTFRKMQEAGKQPKEVADIAQLRVILQPRTGGSSGSDGAPVPLDYGSEKQLCYHVMGLVHTFWAPIPGSMKDYIATPKTNNYQSLHTTVVPTGLDVASSLQNGAGPNGSRPRRGKTLQTLFPIEVQIRTKEMDRLAENGIAVESWSSADHGRWRAASASELESTMESTYGSLLASGGSGDSSSGSGDEDAGAGSNGAARRREGGTIGSWPFNLGSLVSSLAGGKPSGSSSSSSSSGVPAPDRNGSLNGSSPNGAGPTAAAAAAASNGSSSGGEQAAAGRDSTIDPQVLSRRINWLKSIREWQSEFVGTLTASEFVECVTDDLLGQSVFVFTPSGEVVRLPKGATAVDFAYHIHTEVGNTMVGAKVNGKLVPAERELQNAEVVEVVHYKGPINATIIRRHQQWLDAAQTRTARHKIAKFLRQHAALAVSKGMTPPSSTSSLPQGVDATAADSDARQLTWLVIHCGDRPGLLAEVANVIARHDHNITAYSGSADVEAGLFVMEYELEGRPSTLAPMCDELSCIDSVASWSVSCALPDRPAVRPGGRPPPRPDADG